MVGSTVMRPRTVAALADERKSFRPRLIGTPFRNGSDSNSPQLLLDRMQKPPEPCRPMEERDRTSPCARQHCCRRVGNEDRPPYSRRSARRHRRAGFIGAVRPRPGWPARRWPASPRRRLSEAAKPRIALAPRRPTRRRRAAGQRGRHRRGPHLHPQPTCTPAGGPGARARQARRLREATRGRAAQAEALIAAAQASARVATVPFVYRFHPVVREARAACVAGTWVAST